MQTKANDTPKIIALGAGIVFFLGIAAYQFTNANRSAGSTPPPATGVPAVTTMLNQGGTGGTGGSAANGTAATPQQASTSIPKAPPGQMRQLDPVLDAAPEGGVLPSVAGIGRTNSFQQFKSPPVVSTPTPTPPAVNPTKGTSGIALGGPRPNLGTFLPNTTGRSNAEMDGGGLMQPPKDNIPQQEITLDGVVTGTDGFAVLTIHDPGRQNAAIPDTKRFVRLGDEVITGEKVVGILETGLRLSRTRGIWMIGDKRGVTRRGTMLASLPPAPAAGSSMTNSTNSITPPTQTPQ